MSSVGPRILPHFWAKSQVTFFSLSAKDGRMGYGCGSDRELHGNSIWVVKVSPENITCSYQSILRGYTTAFRRDTLLRIRNKIGLVLAGISPGFPALSIVWAGSD